MSSKKLLSIIVFFPLILLLLMLPVIPVLEIYKDKVLIYSTTLLYSNVKVRYSFIHSSELTPWTEIWLINSSGIYVAEMYWRGLGAGHPSSPFDLDSKI